MTDRTEHAVPAAAVGFGLLVSAVAVLFVLFTPVPPPSAEPEVKLVVLVVFDQLRGDLIDKWRPHFGSDGFRRVQKDGAWYTHCHYPYATTSTGPGHAALLSGTSPAVSGIVNNEWYDRREKGQVNCASEARFRMVPGPLKPPAAGDKRPGGSPGRMLVPTVADQLKVAYGERAKVFGVSLKDRSALLPSGQTPDGAFWFDGRFVTSTRYADAAPGWVKAFNVGGTAESYFKRNWAKLRDDLNYTTITGTADNQKGEGDVAGQGTTFPHPTTGANKKGEHYATLADAGSSYYEAVANSPFGNELLLEFAKTCIDAERVGQRGVPDLLTVSFSSNDLVSHCWGPDSHEAFDMTLRSDLILAELLKHLDAKVGAGRYAIILSADHGACPLPEVAVQQGREAKRLPLAKLTTGVEAHLRAKFGNPDRASDTVDPDDKKTERWLEAVVPPYLYLNRKLAVAKKANVADVAAEAARWMKTQEGIEAAYTAADLTTPGEPDSVREMVRLSFYAERSGDVYVVLKPYHLIDTTKPTLDTSALKPVLVMKPATGTTHGSPHEYDRHVPLIVFGPGVAAGRHDAPTSPLSAAAVAAFFLGVPPPTSAAAPPPGLFR